MARSRGRSPWSPAGAAGAAGGRPRASPAPGRAATWAAGRPGTDPASPAGAQVSVGSGKRETCRAVAGEVETRGRGGLAVACHRGHGDELEGRVDASYATSGGGEVGGNTGGLSPLYASPPAVTETMWDKVV